MRDLSFYVIFLGGMVSFLSPCVLSLVPAYIGFLTNDFEVEKNRNRIFVLKRSLWFAAGFSIIFIIMGASIGYVGSFFLRYRLYLMRISGIFIFLFGLKIFGVLDFSMLNRQWQMNYPKVINNGGDALLMGMAFATGWTPCVGPVLASVLLYVGSSTSLSGGIFLLFTYSLGLAIPFLVTALAINQFQKALVKYHKILPLLSKMAGIIMIIMGITIFFNKLIIFNNYFNFFNFKL
ncbi:cytochrome c biogenesis CcdA family protein [Alkaliphilus hydrothermalis]|uniref:Cytochrome c-type biogenesis protein n=1 Tax=Alkaliphilus hydrothermalis TaxID=1482730 RepID=A0ABS2NT14_9FIRM|nr:cytochrome c biogenesis CcdA family protein [Alkaliphilus hydrothermalis]MBM7616078.1 cytochrome c-type biogenesis protein [Alkaliphilus hydrothermalis]